MFDKTPPILPNSYNYGLSRSNTLSARYDSLGRQIAVGATLLMPVVPPAVAGAALTAFSGGLLGLYWRTPRLHEPDDPRPTPEGIPIAKDSWMLAIGLALMADALPFTRH